MKGAKYLVLISLLIFLNCSHKYQRESPINLTHALSLVDSVIINGQKVSYISIYANYPDYQPVGAKDEGIACVDDVGRFMEILEQEINIYGKTGYYSLARGMTNFLLLLSRDDGLWYNFLQEDGRINTSHQNSFADFGWWAVRGLRGLAAAREIFAKSQLDSDLVVKIDARIKSAIPHIHQVLQKYPEQQETPLGQRPAWLLKNAPDMNAELLLTLCRLHRSGNFEFRNEIKKIAKGLVGYQFNNEKHHLDGMYFCWNETWHQWGSTQPLALLKAFEITKDSSFYKSVKKWVDKFVPFLVQNHFPSDITISADGSYELNAYPQIAYGLNATYQGIYTFAQMSDDKTYFRLAENVFGWFKGENAVGKPMYDPLTGRCFDGIDENAKINQNAGAESTIECLAAILTRGKF